MKRLDGITDSMDVNLGKLREVVRDREVCHLAVQGGLEKLDTTWQLNNNMTQLLLYHHKHLMY